eukprot:jgi/Mesen1/6602/ME000338S05776
MFASAMSPQEVEWGRFGSPVQPWQLHGLEEEARRTRETQIGTHTLAVVNELLLLSFI